MGSGPGGLVFQPLRDHSDGSSSPLQGVSEVSPLEQAHPLPHHPPFLPSTTSLVSYSVFPSIPSAGLRGKSGAISSCQGGESHRLLVPSSLPQCMALATLPGACLWRWVTETAPFAPAVVDGIVPVDRTTSFVTLVPAVVFNWLLLCNARDGFSFPRRT